ncbi:uncharacterized protein B0P05DRAFT_527951 [Gilbertella persicaria]|uniref:uncharacterized protein n=1 Tax=Gilbertella persicaria TaxID=101096 RepID=UPI002220AA6F|nr:uncharacterized protein B0P05DRAFT_527951 [Gilbertella persicaria]KAI8090916.1 hypothetical protein B0P05DRAFT_527951 [Gilbertella persicaria]
MGFFDHFSDSHQQLQDTPDEHKGSLTHEVIAAAASYEAVKAYNAHCEKNGKPNDHAKAMEILAGFAGGALDKLIETKGLDYLDKQKAKRHAEEQVKQYYETEHTY